jgi:hypothetical protein
MYDTVVLCLCNGLGVKRRTLKRMTRKSTRSKSFCRRYCTALLALNSRASPSSPIGLIKIYLSYPGIRLWCRPERGRSRSIRCKTGCGWCNIDITPGPYCQLPPSYMQLCRGCILCACGVIKIHINADQTRTNYDL